MAQTTNFSTTSATIAPTPWFPEPKSNPETRLRLFCFPYAGGGALIYRDWSAKLPSTIEVWPAQLPGRGNRLREPCYTNLGQLVEALSESILPYLDKPFAFFGHSLGALIGFELARELRRKQGVEPLHLLVSGHSAPQVPKKRAVTYNLPETALIEEVRRLNGTPKEVLEIPELMELMLPLLRADFEVAQTYAYMAGPPLDCPITAFGGLQDSHVTRDGLAAWGEQTTTAFAMRLLPGDHFFLHSAQAQILQMLVEELHQQPEQGASA